MTKQFLTIILSPKMPKNKSSLIMLHCAMQDKGSEVQSISYLIIQLADKMIDFIAWHELFLINQLWQQWLAICSIINYFKYYMSRDSQVRLSFADYPVSTQQIYSGIFKLSYINTGDQQSHLKNTHDQLVNVNKWLSETQFQQISDLCWSLPGPTTIQIILTIVTLKFKSLAIAINSFLLYNFIPWIVLTIMGLLSNYVIRDRDFSRSYEMIFMGCNAAAAGIMVRNFLTYFQQSLWNWPKIFLTLLTAGIFYHYQNLISIIFCLCLGAVISLYLQIEDTRKKMSSKSQEMFKKLSFNFILGKPSVYMLLSILLGLWVYFSIYTENQYDYLLGFYFVGCFIIGPIDTIFAYFLALILQQESINLMQIWIGIPIAFLLPGTLLNIGIYFGSLLDGVRGGLLSAIFLYIPCFLSLFGLLPQWKYYRDKQGVQRLYQGMVCITTGLSLSMIILILRHCTTIDVSCPICIFIISAYMNYFLNRFSFLLILIGGLLAYMRYISLVCYRSGEYCPFPFNF